jgi:hypothetical protein
MPAIQCPGCKAHVSVKGLINCPLCQTFLDPPFLRELDKADAKKNRAILSPQSVLGPKEWLGLFAIGVIMLGVAMIIYRVAVPSDAQLYDRKVSAALVACQQRIAGLAEYGDAETPPYTKNHGKGDEFYFAWGSGTFHFKNGFGASVKMSASCIGSLSTGEITQLTLSGKQVL